MFYVFSLSSGFFEILNFHTWIFAEMELCENEEMFEYIIDKYQERITDNMGDGLYHMNIFVDNLLYEREDGMPEPEFIEQFLAPPIENAHDKFQRMQKLALSMKTDTDECLENVIDDCKSISDDLKSIERKRRRCEIEIDQKKDEISEAKNYLEEKEEKHANAKKELSESASKLQEEKKGQFKTILTSTGMAAVGLCSLAIPGAGVPIAATMAAGSSALLAKGAIVDEKAIQVQEKAVQDCRDEVKSSKESLAKAEENKNNLKTEMKELAQKQRSLNIKLRRKSNLIEDLKSLQSELCEWNESLGKCVHSLSKFYGRVRVLHSEVVDGYMIDILMKPTKDVCSSFLSLMKCRGCRRVCGREDYMIDMAKGMKRKVQVAIENRRPDAEVEDLV